MFRKVLEAIDRAWSKVWGDSTNNMNDYIVIW